MKTSLLVANQPTQQQLTDYANAVIAVNSYAYAVTNQGLPVLNFPPKNYGDFATKFSAAKQHSLDWTTNIFPSMLQLPVTIVNQAANLFNLEETMIEAYLQMLIQNPDNSQVKADLSSSLKSVVDLINAQVAAITSIEKGLTDFNTNIFNDAKILTDIAQDALTDAGADQDLIKQLNDSIDQMRSQIATAQTMLTYAEIAIGVGIFVALIGVVCCFIPGAQVIGAGAIVLGVAGTATGIAFTVIENKNIDALQKSIDNDQKEISSLGQDIILLQGVSNQFNNLYNLNMAAQKALTTIKDMWNNLSTTITDVNTELTATVSDTNTPDYTKALSDFKLAEKNWNEVVAFSKALVGIKYNWQDAQGNWHEYSSQAPGADNGNVNNVPSQIKQTAA